MQQALPCATLPETASTMQMALMTVCVLVNCEQRETYINHVMGFDEDIQNALQTVITTALQLFGMDPGMSDSDASFSFDDQVA